MKRFPKITYLIALSSFIGWLSTGCNNGASNEATPDAPCRILQSVAVSKSTLQDQTNQTTYEYNAQGNLVKISQTMDKRPVGKAVASWTGTKTVTHAYDSDGYLTASTTEELYVTTTDKTIREQITTTRSYSYASGRLSGYTTKRIGAYGVTNTTTGLLTYTESGDLLTKTETGTNVVHDPAIANEIPGNSTGGMRIWTYQKNQLVDYVEKSGTAESRPLLIENGIITKIIGPNYDVRFTYDAQQRVTKQENYVNGVLNDYYLRTWIDAKPSSAALPAFKGFPAINLFSESGPAGVPASSQSFFRNPSTGQMQPNNESTYAVQTNAQGFTTKIILTAKLPGSPSAQDYTTTETFTYTGCQ